VARRFFATCTAAFLGRRSLVNRISGSTLRRSFAGRLAASRAEFAARPSPHQNRGFDLRRDRLRTVRPPPAACVCSD
jgi:hypothetical protein